ncbi:hypothetical protein RAY_1 [Erwinia phage vB_EamM_RAY]|jgi:hypothetical protein|uniref:Uncharacterized protein n=9 Tax=Agricanvirus TaxID=1984776 RepID=A0A173GDP9_9CAUD|nr:hypothetical protein Ea357_001 [Erwinia phage Ea35-70]YP_009605468.1 hypothetical protein FDH98_gp001 [Erwinia phage vB_EamM_RAY]YP_009605785.1 hypothetical protein FDH99_gp001 [Erwinia phage vB_EamM_Simmy50]YP_009606107.1 hypothetical protein FDI00_gp001 [Erwinia phage vB_EamM_Special G]YP_009621742.1 hypothetical protein FDJ23_gp001 [Erwinia phage vB_EamM_Desertfox]AUG85789.1 hypothetical protein BOSOLAPHORUS_1 [Erwinia phage vB_EamM_Bosolaphorus]AUG86429.1 hypothetical protein MADMEL_1 
MAHDHQFNEASDRGLFDYDADCKVSYFIKSALKTPLFIRQRTGLDNIIPPKFYGGGVMDQVEIMLEFQIKEHVFLDINSKSIEELPPEYAVIAKAINVIKEKRVREHGNYYVGRVVYTFTSEYFERCNGQFYFSVLDMVFSVNSPDETDEHPYCINVLQQTMAAKLKDDYAGLVTYAVKLVDSQTRLGPKYINIAGDVFEVTPTEGQGTESADGLYLIGDAPIRRGKKESTGRTRFTPLDSILQSPEKYGLFSTIGEAKHRGDKQLDAAFNALDAANAKERKAQQKIAQLETQLEGFKAKEKQDNGLVLNKGITELIKLITATIGIVKLLR